MDPEDYARQLAELRPHMVAETVPLTEAYGRICARAVIASSPLPAFATSAMDGFALDAAAWVAAQQGAAIPVHGDVPAGHQAPDIRIGTAVRVMTGAPVPAAAEVVVPVECTDASPTGAVPDRVRCTIPAGHSSGWNIRRIGEDTGLGDVIIPAGTAIDAAGIGTLAMHGVGEITVRCPLRIGILVTGDELGGATDSAPPAVLDPRIPNSNLPMLAAAVRAAGHTALMRTSNDDRALFMSCLDELAAVTDLIITTGGISAGAYEVVRASLGQDHSRFLRIGMRPGGPQGHGRYRGTPLLHFPGTPAAAFLSFHLFARELWEPYRLDERFHTAIFAGEVITGHRRGVSLLPARWNADGEVELLGRTRLSDYARAEVVLRVPRHPALLAPGDLVSVLPLS